MLERVMRYTVPVQLLATVSLSLALVCPAFWPVRAYACPPAVYAANAEQEGAELFATRGCTHCHGSQGTGTEAGPSLRDLRKHLHAERIESQIVHGGKEMPAFGDTLDHAQVTSLVTFLRAKRWIVAPVQTVSPAAK